jgi:hypothetical protein
MKYKGLMASLQQPMARRLQVPGRELHPEPARELTAIRAQVERIERSLRNPKLSSRTRARLEEQRFEKLQTALLVWRWSAEDLVRWAMERLQRAERIPFEASHKSRESYRSYVWWLLTRTNDQLPLTLNEENWVPLILPGYVYSDLLEAFSGGTTNFLPPTREGRSTKPYKQRFYAKLNLLQMVYYHAARANFDPADFANDAVGEVRALSAESFTKGRQEVASRIGGNKRKAMTWLNNTESRLRKPKSRREFSTDIDETSLGLDRAADAGTLSRLIEVTGRMPAGIHADVRSLLDKFSRPRRGQVKAWYLAARGHS